MARHRKKGPTCPNCGTELRAEFEFCPHCGQENHDLRVPFRHFLYEFVESITHFDTKLWNTLRSIFTRPGQLTKDFVEGKRARYVNPARFYVFTSVIFFALLALWVDRDIEEAAKNPISAASTLDRMLPADAMRSLLADSDLVAHLFLPIDSPWYAPMRKRLLQGDAQLVDSLIADAGEDTLPGVRRRLASAFLALPDTSQLDVQRLVRALGTRVVFPNKAEEKHFLRISANMTDAQADSILRTDTHQEPTWIKRRVIRSMGRLQVGSIQGTQRLAHLVVKNISVVMFLLMPFTAVLLLWIFFRKRYYWEHLIFSVHLHTIFFLFFILMLVITLLVPGELPDWVSLLVAFLCLVYLLVSLHRVYGRQWGATLLRFVLMSIPYGMVFLVLLVIGLLWGFASL